MAKRTILLWAEQGLGDTLQFIRYAPIVKEMGATVILGCAGSMIKLLSRCRGIDKLVAREGEMPDVDTHVPLLNLPTLFGTTVVFPGIADVGTLRDLSALAGEHEIATTTVGHAVGERGRIRPSSSISTVRVARLPVDVISRGTPGSALVLAPDRSFGSVTLTPAHAVSPWRELTMSGRAPRAHEPRPSRAPEGRSR